MLYDVASTVYLPKANPGGYQDPSNILGGCAAARGASRIESVYIVSAK